MNKVLSKINSWFLSSDDKNINKKSSLFSNYVAFTSPGQPMWSQRNYGSFANEGYQKNVIVHRCISEIARSIALVPLKLYDRDEILCHHPIIDLLQRPNPLQGSSSFLESIVSTWLISGNAFIEIVGDEPHELYNLRPDRIKIQPGKNGVPASYHYQVGDKTYRFDCDPVTGQSMILHLKFFHPLDDLYGLSPIEAASFSIDQHNASGAHNQALLQNGARPMGALIYRGLNMTQEQRAQIKDQMTQYEGAKNAGKVMMLEGDFEWKEMGLKPRDMDFVSAKNIASRDIAQAFGVPPVLVGIPGDSTYNNMAEARVALWEQTIIPLMDHLTDALNHWLVPFFDANENLKIKYDLDQIPALAPRRQMVWERIRSADFLTMNEKRVALGYPPIPSPEYDCV